MTPEQREKVIEMCKALSDEEINALTRYCIRVLNNDPRAERLAKLLQAGQISRRQFLDAM